MSGQSRIAMTAMAILATMNFACADRPARAKDEPPTAREGGVVSDAGITRRIDTTYLLNLHLSAMALEVDTRQGVVTLSGTVPSDVHRDLAVAIARSAEGVRDVHDRLSVDEKVVLQAPPSSPPDERRAAGRTFGQMVHDATITASIKMKLAAGNEVAAHDINVDTRQGRVMLTGQVASEAERQLAVRIARDTEGVREVENDIQVSRG